MPDSERMKIEGDVLPPYSVHDTFLGGEVGDVVSRHDTEKDAVRAAGERLDKRRVVIHGRKIIWPPQRDQRKPSPA